MVVLKTISDSYINVSGKIYDSEFINLVNIKNKAISFDDRTIFLTETEKNALNSHPIELNRDSIYIFEYKGTWGMICWTPIDEYNKGVIKSHELVIPEVVQGMLSNMHGYNTEAAPVLLGHEETINLENLVTLIDSDKTYHLGEYNFYQYSGKLAKQILKEYQYIENLYIGDGHHRLYSTSLSDQKQHVLSCIVGFDFLEILPIHRIMNGITIEQFENSLNFLKSKFSVKLVDSNEKTKQGFAKIHFSDKCYEIELIDLASDAFWNNDIYRINTQIISQAFRVFDSRNIEYISPFELASKIKANPDSEEVIIETHPLSVSEFIDTANQNNILPPKTTWFNPKFPSFLVMAKYS